MGEEAKWFKIVNNIFDDRKIKALEKLPNGDSVVLIWFKLLALASKINNDGIISITERISYKTDVLAGELNVSNTTVLEYALTHFEDFEMIEKDELDRIIILNWEKHQNAVALRKLRETEKRKQKRSRRRAKLGRLGWSKEDIQNIESQVELADLEIRKLPPKKDENSLIPLPLNRNGTIETVTVRLERNGTKHERNGTKHERNGTEMVMHNGIRNGTIEKRNGTIEKRNGTVAKRYGYVPSALYIDKESTIIINIIIKKINRELSDFEKDLIVEWLNIFPSDVILEAFKIAYTSNPEKHNFNYIDAILKNWKTANVTNLEDVKALNKKYQSKKYKRYATDDDENSEYVDWISTVIDQDN